MRYLSSIFLLWLAVCVSATTLSADLPSPDLTDSLSEVTVTATDARLSLIDKRISVAQQSFMLREIEQEKIVAPKDLTSRVPNLYMPDYGSRMTSSIYIRGMGARIDNPVIGLYLDGIGIANKNAYDLDLSDIRRMQLFRGPQGTLFGKNTIGGVMSITTLSPLEYSGTRASVGYANHNTITARASHYARINDEVGIAAAAYYKHTDGAFRNTYDNSRADRQDNANARLNIAWTGKNTSAQFNNLINYNFVSQEGFPYHLTDRPVNHNDYCGYLRHSLIEGLRFKLPIGNMQMSSTTSYQLLIDRMNMDQDYQPLSYFTLTQAQTEHFLSEELLFQPQQVKRQTSWWDHISGLSLSYRHNTMTAPVVFKQDGIDSLILKNANNGIRSAGFPASVFLTLSENTFPINSLFYTQNANAALFHTSFFTFGRWTIEAGLRLDFEYLDFRYQSDGLIHYNIEGTPHRNREINTVVNGRTHLISFEALPRLAISYTLPKVSLHAAIAEGYKGGGFNTQLFSDILQNRMMDDMMQDMGVAFAQNNDYQVADVVTYKPERCLTSELGIKTRHHFTEHGTPHSISADLTLYELEIFNQQLTVYPEKGTGRFMTNAGRSRSWGAELTADYRYADFSLSLSYGYNNARFVRYNNGKQDFSGNYVPCTPSHTLAASATYSLPLNHSFFQRLNFNVNTQALGPIYWNEENTDTGSPQSLLARGVSTGSPQSLLARGVSTWSPQSFARKGCQKEPFYALLNANLTLKMKNISLSLWGKNLSCTRYHVFRFVSMGNTLMQDGQPISFGATLDLEI